MSDPLSRKTRDLAERLDKQMPRLRSLAHGWRSLLFYEAAQTSEILETTVELILAQQEEIDCLKEEIDDLKQALEETR